MNIRPIDWPQVLGDIAYLLGDAIPGTNLRQPLGTERLARELGIARSTVRNILDGTEPRHSDGERFISRWASLSGKPGAFAPRLVRPEPQRSEGKKL